MATDPVQVGQMAAQRVDAHLVAGRFDEAGAGLQVVGVDGAQAAPAGLRRQRPRRPQRVADGHGAALLQLRADAAVQQHRTHRRLLLLRFDRNRLSTSSLSLSLSISFLSGKP